MPADLREQRHLADSQPDTGQPGIVESRRHTRRRPEVARQTADEVLVPSHDACIYTLRGRRRNADAPDAFASTLEREAAFPDDVWRQRAKGGPASASFIAREDGVGVGMTAVIAEPVPGRVQLVGMWVDPRHRRRGNAEALIGQAVRWSRDHQARELIAWVAENNTAARRLYAHVGFQPAGARQPHPSNPAIDELLLRLPLASPLSQRV
jgi:GNAT superfamily N-acetyltransferase